MPSAGALPPPPRSESAHSMSASKIVQALGGEWRQSYGLAFCPCHRDHQAPSLKVSDNLKRRDGIDLHCFAGCHWQLVKAELQRRGLLPPLSGVGKHQQIANFKASPPESPKPTQPRRRRTKSGAARKQKGLQIERAKDLWADCRGAGGTRAESYLRNRGITLPVPESIRFHPAAWNSESRRGLPAIVAAVHNADGQVTAVHRIYLDSGGNGQAKLVAPKMALGSFDGGAIRLAAAQHKLGLAEGVETGLSVMQLFDIPVWVAAGTRFHRVALPAIVREVTVFPDNGTPGHDAADRAVELFTQQGRRVFVQYPPAQYGDWNDVLIALAEESQ